MVFSSISFLFIFLPLALSIYFILKRSYRNLFLLLASLGFYAFGEGRYVIVMLLYMVANYYFGVLIDRRRNSEPAGNARLVLIFSLIFNLGFLLFFKYFNFIVDNLNIPLGMAGFHINVPKVHLPIGISFFTFQAVSYVIDVYRGAIKSQQSLVNFSMYKSLFPQLIAGPIVRYKDIADQIDDRSVTAEQFHDGIHRFIIGLGKKVIIANTLADIADTIFALPASSLPASTAWLGVICYAFQIFFDFSGYSDMAIGLGKMFGFTFLENFKYPYISQSIREFWRRWHISLSSWFRDYVYISLGGNRCSSARIYFNLFTVFILTGFWHGASWNFIIWGLWHGAFMLIERSPAGKLIDRMFRPLRHLYLITAVLIGWVFFRAENLHAAIYYLKAMFDFSHINNALYPAFSYINRETFTALFFATLFSTPIAPYVRDKIKSLSAVLPGETAKTVISPIREIMLHIGLSIIFLYCIMSLTSGTYNPFIYFRF